MLRQNLRASCVVATIMRSFPWRRSHANVVATIPEIRARRKIRELYYSRICIIRSLTSSWTHKEFISLPSHNSSTKLQVSLFPRQGYLPTSVKRLSAQRRQLQWMVSRLSYLLCQKIKKKKNLWRCVQKKYNCNSLKHALLSPKMNLKLIDNSKFSLPSRKIWSLFIFSFEISLLGSSNTHFVSLVAGLRWVASFLWSMNTSKGVMTPCLTRAGHTCKIWAQYVSETLKPVLDLNKSKSCMSNMCRLKGCVLYTLKPHVA